MILKRFVKKQRGQKFRNGMLYLLSMLINKLISLPKHSDTIYLKNGEQRKIEENFRKSPLKINYPIKTSIKNEKANSESLNKVFEKKINLIKHKRTSKKSFSVRAKNQMMDNYMCCVRLVTCGFIQNAFLIIIILHSL